MRRSPTDHEVILSATTADGSLSVGASPNFGFLIINIPVTTMREKQAGQYVGDIVGHDEQYSKVVIQLDLTIVEGVTKWPSPA